MLAERGSPQLEPLLEQAAGSEDAGLRFLAARLRGMAPDPADTMETAFTGTRWLRGEALRAFMDGAHAEAIAGDTAAAAARFFAILDTPAPPEVRVEAVEGLGALGRPQDVEALLPYRDDPDLTDAVWAAQARVCAAHAGTHRDTLAALAREAPLHAAAIASEALAGLGEEVTVMARARGFLTDWLVLGPAPPGAEALEAIPEQTAAADPPARLVLEGVEFGWSEVRAGGVPATVELGTVLGAYTGVAAFGFARFFASAWTPAELRVGSSDGCEVWLNGAQVLRAEGPREFQPDDNRAPIVLRPGVNRLLIKVLQQRGAWRYCVRIMDRRGEAVDVTALAPPDDGAGGVGLGPEMVRAIPGELP